MSDQSSTPESNPPENPRAFAQGTGHVCTIIGTILMLGGCCIGSFSGIVQGEQAEAPHDLIAWVRQSPVQQLLSAMNIIVTGAGGLALLTFGIGLQQERKSSGAGATITAVALALVWWGSTVGTFYLAFTAPVASAWGVVGTVLRVVMQLAIALGSTFLVLLTASAWRNLRQNPPPPDEPVTEEFLQELAARRRHRAHGSDH